MINRIKELRKTLSLSQSDFGKKLGVSRDVINNIEQGRNKNEISEIFTAHICNTYHVNPDWLRTGEGEMFTAIDDSPLTVLKKQYNLSSKACKILDNFFKLSSSEQDSFIEEAQKIFNLND